MARGRQPGQMGPGSKYGSGYVIVNNAANTEAATRQGGQGREDNLSLIYEVIIKLCIQRWALKLQISPPCCRWSESELAQWEARPSPRLPGEVACSLKQWTQGISTVDVD